MIISMVEKSKCLSVLISIMCCSHFVFCEEDNNLSSDNRIVDLGNNTTMEFSWIPSGDFNIGSTQSERDWATGDEGKCSKNEVVREGKTPRLVTITDGFWIGKHEVTYGQFSKFTEDSGYISDGETDGRIYTYNWELQKWSFVDGKSWRDPNFGFPFEKNHPVVSVSWNDAMAFCNWLTEEKRAEGMLPEGFEYRLPTEAEWEYCCRAGCENAKFWWGDDLTDANGRMNGSGADSLSADLPNNNLSTGFPHKDGFAFVAPVGNFGERGENSFGLSDMLGNVYEWTMDEFNEDGATKTVCLDGKNQRIIKGGAFTSPAGFYRIAYRSPWNPDVSCGQVGFRAVLGKGIILRSD